MFLCRQGAAGALSVSRALLENCISRVSRSSGCPIEKCLRILYSVVFCRFVSPLSSSSAAAQQMLSSSPKSASTVGVPVAGHTQFYLCPDFFLHPSPLLPILIDSDFKIKFCINYVPGMFLGNGKVCCTSVHTATACLTLSSPDTASLHRLLCSVCCGDARLTNTLQEGRECLLSIPLAQTWEHVAVGITSSSVSGPCQPSAFFCQHEMSFEAHFED